MILSISKSNLAVILPYRRNRLTGHIRTSTCLWLVLGMGLLTAINANGQNINRQMVVGLLTAIKGSGSDTNRVRILVELGKFQIYKAGEDKRDLDSGLDYFNEACRLSDSLGSIKWQHETSCLIMIDAMERGDSVRGRKLYEKQLADCRRTGDRMGEAVALLRWGIWQSAKGNFYPGIIDDYRRSQALYLACGDKENAIRVQREIGYTYMNERKLPNIYPSMGSNP